jgi:hypothetical protein
MGKLEPKCLSGKGYGYTATGYLVPCCWCDPRENMPNEQITIETKEIKDMFFKEHLKLTNVNNIMEILRSKEWKDFYNTLLDDDSNNALEVCKRYCGTTKSTKLKLQATPADGMKIQYKIKDNSTGIKIRAVPDKWVRRTK